MHKKKFIIVGVIVALALAFVGYTAFQHAATYYLTVSELRAKGASLDDTRVRVTGMLSTVTPAPGTGKPKIQFVLSENGENLQAVYQGTVPDAFKVGNQVMAEGRLDSSGVFQADTIITKCPSKYEPAKQ